MGRERRIWSGTAIGCRELPLGREMPVYMVERLREAWNAHDADAVAALFATDYRSFQPTHPGRAFVGRSQVLTNWSSVFEGVPNFTARLVALTKDADTEWAEWDWSGTHSDGTPFLMRGVTILTMRRDLIAEGRLYLEPVEVSGADIDSAVNDLYRRDP